MTENNNHTYFLSTYFKTLSSSNLWVFLLSLYFDSYIVFGISKCNYSSGGRFLQYKLLDLLLNASLQKLNRNVCPIQVVTIADFYFYRPVGCCEKNQSRCLFRVFDRPVPFKRRLKTGDELDRSCIGLSHLRLVWTRVRSIYRTRFCYLVIYRPLTIHWILILGLLHCSSSFWKIPFYVYLFMVKFIV